MKETSTPKTARSSGGAKLQRSGDRPDRSRSPVKKDKDRARDSPAKSSQDGEIGETQQWEDPRNAIQVSSTEYCLCRLECLSEKDNDGKSSLRFCCFMARTRSLRCLHLTLVDIVVLFRLVCVTCASAFEREEQEGEEEGDDVTHTCQFCGKYDPSFTDEKLDMHYWQTCPMLQSCHECGQVRPTDSARGVTFGGKHSRVVRLFPNRRASPVLPVPRSIAFSLNDVVRKRGMAFLLQVSQVHEQRLKNACEELWVPPGCK